MSQKLWTFVRTERFVDQFRELDGRDHRLEQFMLIVEWTLARNPRVGKKTSTADIWAVDSRFLRYDVTVYYSFNENQIILEGVMLEDAEDSPENE
jgi:hypothetical protein